MLLFVDTQFASPYAMSAFVALQEKGLRFDMQMVDLSAGEQGRPPYAGLSLTQRVPTLLDKGFALSESSAIAEYLEDVCPGPALYPAEPTARARARQVQAWLRSDFQALRQERSTEVLFYRPSRQPLSAVALASAHKLFAAAQALLHHHDDCLFGQWSIADTDLALMLNRLAQNGDEMPQQLRRYATLQWQRPSVQRWLEQPRPLR